MPVILLFLAGCGGRTLDRPDAGDADADADGDSDSDADSDGDADVVAHCYGGFELCPWDTPYCCHSDDYTECTADPEGFVDRNGWESGCAERIREESMVSVDCFDGGLFHPEECPEGFPHCCSYSDPRKICVDHLPVGWRCDE